ncbi:MAG: putative membrane protein [Psychromonas sp.]|jgi:uncharacterized membrane protein
MNYNKITLSELINSTFLTLSLFILFDIFIQGYATYHNWVLSALIGLFTVYYLIVRHYAMPVN